MRLWRTRDAVIDTLITSPVPRFTGHDESLQVQADERRKRAEAIKLEALKLDTRDDRKTRLRLVNEREDA